MDFGLLINALPLWILFVLTATMSIIAVEAGTRLAKVVLRRQEKEPEGPLGSLVNSVLGLLALILAFAFGMTAARFDARKQLVLEEANATRSCYLRAGLLPENQKLEIRRLLRDYVEIRLNGTMANVAEILQQSAELQDRLWIQGESLVKADMDSELRTLFLGSLNQVFEINESRKTVGLLYRIPGTIWLSLYALTLLSMLAIGYQIGMSGARRLSGMPVMAGAFSLVIVMIADIDRAGHGKFQVSQQPVADVQQMMQRMTP
jgi:hypothetical protein